MSLVVKNGSNTRARTSGGMPWPVSAIEILTKSPRAVLGLCLHVLNGDDDDAAIGHGVPRIQAQVQNRELHFAGIDFDRPGVRREGDLHVDVSAQRSVEHGSHAVQVCGDVDDSGLSGWRREKASSCRVKPVPRATARRMASNTRGPAAAAG